MTGSKVFYDGEPGRQNQLVLPLDWNTLGSFVFNCSSLRFQLNYSNTGYL